MKDLEIQFENDDLIVVEKPAGIVVIPTKKTPQVSVQSLLLRARPQQKALGVDSRFGIVHRLDKNTSGLVLVAKTENTFEYLTNLFRDRKIVKEYQALVYGKIEKYGVIDKRLTKIGQRGISKVRVDEEGKPSKTEYWPMGHYQDGLDSYTLLRVQLHTGRTHQIRVHFFSERHPVMGDDLYGKPESLKLNDILHRQFLHAAELEFQLPDKTWLSVGSELPEDLRKVLQKLDKVNAS